VTLGDLFISQIQEKGPCFILETHSEHMLLRLLRRIRETSEGILSSENYALTPDQLAIYYVEPGENGLTVSRIRVDQDGDFKDQWPRGFFNERVEELY
jgi:predicted ATPase